MDSGAVIAWGRGDRKTTRRIREAVQRAISVTVPADVIVETWRGGPRAARIAALLEMVEVEPLTEELARDAGVALGMVTGSTAIDAVVMTSASRRGDIVLTSDVEDLMRLQDHCPMVGLVAV